MFEAQRYTRKAILQRAGAAGGLIVMPGILAACGDDDEEPKQTGGADVKASLENATGTVRTLMWEGYESPKAYRPISDRVEVKAAFMAANEDVINKRKTYDIGVGINGIYPSLQQAGVLQPLDLERIPNMKLVMDQPELFTDLRTPIFTEFDGKPYGMPYVWAAQGVSYLPDKVPGPPESLEDFLGPAYEGKLGIGDDGNSVIIMVARLLGLGGDRPAYLSEQEFDEVFDKLEEFKAQAKGVIANPYGEYSSAYARGEIIAAFPDWAPTTVAAKEGGVNAVIAFPNQSFSWVDTLFINAEVEATDAMYAFLNQGLDNRSQLQLGTDLGIAVVNGKAQSSLVERGEGWAVYGDVAKLTASAPVTEWPPAESDEYVTYTDWLKRWQQFKAS